MSPGESPTTEVYGSLFECQSLTLVYGDGPCQSYGQLHVGSQCLLLYLLLLLVVGIAYVLPYLTAYRVFFPPFGDDTQFLLLLVNLSDGTQRPVHPPLVLVILDEDDLCSHLQFQFHRGWHHAIGEVSLYLATEHRRLPRQTVQFRLVDEVHVVASGSQRNSHVHGFSLLRLRVGRSCAYPCVQQTQFRFRDAACPHVIQRTDEDRVLLPVNLAQFYADQFHFPEYAC